ncbi:MAG: GNAT family N-acetyltransferase [Pseudomonadota bacterium]
MSYPIRSIAAEQTLAFRRTHMWPDKPLDHVKVPGDETALHLGAFDGEGLIGVASFFQESPGIRLRKLAVAPNYRGAGLGSDLVQEGAQLAREQGFTELWCDARQSARGFYEALGFKLDEATFEKSGLTYQIARLNL